MLMFHPFHSSHAIFVRMFVIVSLAEINQGHVIVSFAKGKYIHAFVIFVKKFPMMIPHPHSSIIIAVVKTVLRIVNVIVTSRNLLMLMLVCLVVAKNAFLIVTVIVILIIPFFVGIVKKNVIVFAV